MSRQVIRIVTSCAILGVTAAATATANADRPVFCGNSQVVINEVDDTSHDDLYAADLRCGGKKRFENTGVEALVALNGAFDVFMVSAGEFTAVELGVPPQLGVLSMAEP
jgi:hypothetical protein